MVPIPEKILQPYLAFLEKEKIDAAEIPHFLKWLRFYLDFCEKYAHPVSSQDSLPLFKTKLTQKNQTDKQITQAEKAIRLFYRLIESLKRARTNSIPPVQIGEDKTLHKKMLTQDLAKNQS